MKDLFFIYFFSSFKSPTAGLQPLPRVPHVDPCGASSLAVVAIAMDYTPQAKRPAFGGERNRRACPELVEGTPFLTTLWVPHSTERLLLGRVGTLTLGPIQTVVALQLSS